MLPAKLEHILSNSKEVTLLGYYGANNIGDDLMLAGLLSQMCHYGAKVKIISYGPIPWLENSFDVSQWRRGDHYHNLRMYSSVTADSDLILIGGGTCFTDEDGDGFFPYVSYSKLGGKKIAYHGIGIGNLKRLASLAKTKSLLFIANYVSFRDSMSYELACKWAASGEYDLIEDLAIEPIFSAFRSFLSTRKKERAYLLVAWRNLSRYPKTNPSLEKVADLIRSIQKQTKVSDIIIMNADSAADGDIGYGLMEILTKSCGSVNVSYNDTDNYLNKLQLIYDSEAVITARLHVAIAASIAGKPCHVYDYSPKVRAYFIDYTYPDTHFICL